VEKFEDMKLFRNSMIDDPNEDYIHETAVRPGAVFVARIELNMKNVHYYERYRTDPNSMCFLRDGRPPIRVDVDTNWLQNWTNRAISRRDFEIITEQLKEIVVIANQKNYVALDAFMVNPYVPLHQQLFVEGINIWNALMMNTRLVIIGLLLGLTIFVVYFLAAMLCFPVWCVYNICTCKCFARNTPEELAWMESMITAHPDLDAQNIENDIRERLDGLTHHWSGMYRNLQFVSSFSPEEDLSTFSFSAELTSMDEMTVDVAEIDVAEIEVV
jgi:hypothetical protein